MINRDTSKPIGSTGFYCVGFTVDSMAKYFHVKLGPKSIICGYENLYNKKAEYTYKAMMHVDAFGLRKSKLKPIFDTEPQFRTQMSQYVLEFYHTIVRKPMMVFKKNIFSQISKRQNIDKIMA